ncbi:MAG TPA: malto-oligosyltrehalose synthase, partial [Ilumatobacteraceae bacterium]|nr:malto-oligosyltrehalose synthase [Ilumatobacteraceae bacterium]
SGDAAGSPFVAIYRLQLTPSFTLDDAVTVVPYLAALGVSHVYTSPYFTAMPGSTHGYDVTNPTEIDPQLGGEAALARFHAVLARHGMSNVIDVVANHMAIGGRYNAWWWDVLRHGRDSAWAHVFDIDWDRSPFAGKVLLPVLGSPYGDSLAAGHLRVVSGPHDEPEVAYFDHRFPLDPASLHLVPRDDDPHRLHVLLDAQHYRLAWWRVGREQINVRRFFEVDTLAGVRVEDPAVFAATHARIRDLAGTRAVTGLRVDHPDGLADPTGYFHRLRILAPDAWIVAEKILEPGESLPAAWPIDGTTGYDAMRLLTGVFVDPAGRDSLTATWHRVSGDPTSFGLHRLAGKQLAADHLLASETDRLTTIAMRIAERSTGARDTTASMMRDALVAVLVHCPVYRTYVRPSEPVSPQDAAVIEATMAAARTHQRHVDRAVFGLVESLWRGEHDDPEAAEFVVRLQQLTGPVMAKGAEDTAFYRDHRLSALNEVGGDPSRFGVTAAEFHAAMAATAARHPATMVATSTHDTKRSEDVRLRIALLAAIAEEWDAAVVRWQQINRDARAGIDPATEYLVYQTLVGAWPIDAERMGACALKAVREAKVATSWVDPNPAYEAALGTFVGAILGDAMP